MSSQSCLLKPSLNIQTKMIHCRSIFCLTFALYVGAISGFQSPMLTTSFRTSTTARAATSDVTRRAVFGTAAASALWLDGMQPGFASDIETLDTFTDAPCNIKLSVPASWEKSEQSLPDRRRIVFFIEPDSDKKTLLFVAFTPVRDDFTSLGSFGTPAEVAQSTILPKSELAGVESDSKMLSAESQKSAYFFDYTAKAGGQPKTHFRTIFALINGATGGAGSILVTATVQTPESMYAEKKPLFDSIMASYGKMK